MTQDELRWYAQHLNDAIRRHQLVPLRFRIDGEPPNFATRGAHQTHFPGIFHTIAPPAPRLGIPPARIKLGREDLQRAQARMTTTQRDAWWAWMLNLDHEGRTRRRSDDKRLPPGAMYRINGRTVEAAPDYPLASQAGMIVLTHATITAYAEPQPATPQNDPRGPSCTATIP